EHHSGELGGYTSERLPVKLVYSAEFPTREEALTREMQVKNWSRKKKEALIAGDWKRLRTLARGTDRWPSR
ncbi:MAG TPA: GIY-YIG nuclease family protein, partial [Archangium sp.]